MTNHKNGKLHTVRLVRHLLQFTNTHQELIKTFESSAKARQCIYKILFQSRWFGDVGARQRRRRLFGSLFGFLINIHTICSRISQIIVSWNHFETALYRNCEKLLKMFKQFDSFCDLMRNWKFHNASLRLTHEQLPTQSIQENLLSHLLHEICNANNQKSLFQPSEKKLLLFFAQEKVLDLICHFFSF